MKAVLSGKVTPDFKPMELKVTIETLEELQEMFHRMNIISLHRELTNDTSQVPLPAFVSTEAVFKVINDVLVDTHEESGITSMEELRELEGLEGLLGTLGDLQEKGLITIND